jgi:hypothetical protein
MTLPYVVLTSFVVGHVWRYRHDQFGRTTRSSQLHESRLLRLGSPMFHFGLLAVLAGHVLGIGIPASWAAAVGVSDHAYWASGPTPASHVFSAPLGYLVPALRRLPQPRPAAPGLAPLRTGPEGALTFRRGRSRVSGALPALRSTLPRVPCTWCGRRGAGGWRPG